MTKANLRKIATVIFCDQNLNFLVQLRNSRSKVGEKYGFFGGGIEKDETSEQALRRELREELDYAPEVLKYWGVFKFKIIMPGTNEDGEIRTAQMYISSVTQKLLDATSEDDTEKAMIPMEDVLRNKNQDFGPVEFLDAARLKSDLKKYLKLSFFDTK